MAPIIDSGTISAIKDAVTPIAQKIGEGAAHLYWVFVKQQIVDGAINLLQVVIFGVLMWYLVKLVKKASAMITSETRALTPEEKVTYRFLVSALAALIFLALLSAAYHAAQYGLARTINPEYYAIQDLLNQVKGK